MHPSGHSHPSQHNPLSHPHAAHDQKHAAAKVHKKSGIKVLITYSVILSFFYLFYLIVGIYKPELLFLGGLFRSYMALLADLVLIIFLFVMVYGLNRRKRWAWWACITWYALSIINSIWSVYIMKANVYNILHELLILSSVFIIMINLLIIWYTYYKRGYFINPHSEESFMKRDKAFVYSLVCFWAVLILISMSIGYNFYKETTEMAQVIIDEMRGTTPLHAIEICETKDGKDRDICFVVFVTIFQNDDMTPVCGRIDSDLYRFSCMQVR